MTKKILTIIIITFLAVSSVFFAFGKSNSGNEVVFWTLQMSDFSDYIYDVISEFESQNPQIKIKWVDVPFSEGEKRTLASVLSDNPPDLVNLNPDFSSTLAHKGALYEIEKDNLNQFNEEILNSLKTEDKFYAISWYPTSSVTLYNKVLFKKGGVSVPQTYSQLMKYSKYFRKNANSYIFLPNITENDTMLKLLNKYGVSGSIQIPKNKSVEIFDSFKYMYKNDLIPKETVTITLQEALEKYMSENVALMVAGANFLNMIKENAPTAYLNTDVAPQIVGSEGQYDFSLMNFVIPLRSKHKQQALKFALFLTNEENQLKLAKLTNVLAVNKQTLKNDFYNRYNKDDLISKARVISARQLNSITPVFKTEKNQKEINNLVNAAVQQILLDKGNTRLILKKVSSDWEKLGK